MLHSAPTVQKGLRSVAWLHQPCSTIIVKEHMYVYVQYLLALSFYPQAYISESCWKNVTYNNFINKRILRFNKWCQKSHACLFNFCSFSEGLLHITRHEWKPYDKFQALQCMLCRIIRLMRKALNFSLQSCLQNQEQQCFIRSEKNVLLLVFSVTEIWFTNNDKKGRWNRLSCYYKAAGIFFSTYWHMNQNTDSDGFLQHLSVAYEQLESI